MRLNTLFSLLVLLFACLAAAQVSYEDCCLSHGKSIENRVRRNAVSYRWQIPDGGCNIRAIIFTTRRGRVLCADPKEKWTKQVQKMLDSRRALHRKVPSIKQYRKSRT